MSARAATTRSALLLGVALLCGAAFAQSREDDPAAADRAAQEARLKTDLEAVRDAQRRLDAERRGVAGERDALLQRLREDELAIGAIGRELAGIDARLATLSGELTDLDAQRAAIEQRLADQRHAIAALLRSAHAAGRHERLRIVFAPEQIGRIQRALAYHRYLQRDRVARVDALRIDLDALTEVRARIESTRTESATARSSRQAQADALAQARAQRAATLAGLQVQLDDQAARLAALGRDERGLLNLLERLRDAIADIPKVLAGAEPFGSRRGRLPWPTRGRVVEAFGSPGAGGRVSEGVLIDASPGAAVQAISHGRVAFADWMTGYGLLLILDHGDGYMSLYAHNDALRVDVGDWVDAGEAIATAGSSGGRSEPALYFELRAKGRPVDPAAWLIRR